MLRRLGADGKNTMLPLYRLVGYAALATISFVPSLGSPLSPHDPTVFGCDAKYFFEIEDSTREQVLSPDGRKRIVLRPDGDLRVQIGKQEIGRFHYRDLSINVEVTWSPDSSHIALMYSDGGAIGLYHTHVVEITEGRAVEDRLTRIAFKDFKSHHSCLERENNVFFLGWTEDSRAAFLVTEVYPTGDCGEEMSKFAGYLMDVGSQGILKRFGEQDTMRIEHSCRTSGKLELPEDQKAAARN